MRTTTTLGEEILAGRKFGGNKIWRNWRMQKNVNFGRNLIWRMQENVNFGGNLIWRMAKNIFLREFNLANKQKIEYNEMLFYQTFLLKT